MSSWARCRRAALCNALIFSAAFTFACGGIHCCIPVPPIFEVREKLDFLKEHIDDYDTLFVGTSRVYHGIIPVVFDELSARSGTPAKSFNAGVDGMHPPEDSFLFDQIQKLHPKNLRRVFIEVNPISTAIKESERGTERTIYWHDWDRLVWVVRETFDIEPAKHWLGTLKRYLAAASTLPIHVELFLLNMSNAGRASAALRSITRLEMHPDVEAALGPLRDGYSKLPHSAMTPNERENYDSRVEDLRGHPREFEYGSIPSQKLLRQLVEKIKAAGAAPVLLVMPRTAHGSLAPNPAYGPWPLVLNFENPARFKELYEDRYRADGDHFNGAGAELFTNLLVKFAGEGDLGFGSVR